MSNPIVLGLTGAIGSGKSTVLKIFNALDSTLVISADDIVDELYECQYVKEKLIYIFGGSVISNDNVNKAYIRQQIKKYPELLEKLEELIHPLVKRYIKRKIDSTTVNFVIIEVPLLFESGFDALCDYTAYVKVDDNIRLTRIKNSIKHKGMLDIYNSKKLDDSGKCTFTIDNTTIESATEDVKEIYKKLCETRVI